MIVYRREEVVFLQFSLSSGFSLWVPIVWSAFPVPYLRISTRAFQYDDSKAAHNSPFFRTLPIHLSTLFLSRFCSPRIHLHGRRGKWWEKESYSSHSLPMFLLLFFFRLPFPCLVSTGFLILYQNDGILADIPKKKNAPFPPKLEWCFSKSTQTSLFVLPNRSCDFDRILLLFGTIWYQNSFYLLPQDISIEWNDHKFCPNVLTPVWDLFVRNVSIRTMFTLFSPFSVMFNGVSISTFEKQRIGYRESRNGIHSSHSSGWS